jgi:hypothetical protein
MCLQAEVVQYSFAADGGAVGYVSLGSRIPNNSLVYDIIVRRETACTSGGAATIQMYAGTTELTDAIAFDAPGATYSFARNTKMKTSSVEPVLVSAAGELKFRIQTAALTAGKLQIVVLFAGLTLN